MRNRFSIFTVVFATLFLSVALLYSVHANMARIEASRTELSMDYVQFTVSNRLNHHVDLLEALRAHLVVEGAVSQRGFQLFLRALEMDRQVPEGYGMGYVRYLPAGKREELERWMRRSYPSYRVWPASTQRMIAPVVLQESVGGGLRSQVLGYDALSEPRRRQAIELAIETGEAAFTSVVQPRLDNESTASELALLVYLPYYGQGQGDPREPQLRREMVRGLVYAPIRLQDFFWQVFGPSYPGNENFSYRLELAEPTGGFRTVYERAGGGRLEEDDAQVRSRSFRTRNLVWTLTMKPLVSFLTPFEELQVPFAWVIVAVLTTFVFMIVARTRSSLEEESRAQRLSEEASKAKSYFLANMSHEIRTPLGAVVGFGDALSRGGLSEEQRSSYANSLQKNVDVLTRIVDDVLDLSKIEASKMGIEKRRTSMSGLVADLQNTMQAHAAYRGKTDVQLVFEMGATYPAYLHTDEVRLKQILMNLLSNALKFTEVGSVKLRVRGLRPTSSSSAGGRVEFWVEDTGIGIPASLQSALFQPFFQGDASTTRRYGGTGLGLRLSQELAHLLGGKIELMSSRPGLGSVFRLSLPVGSIETEWVESGAEALPAPLPERPDARRDAKPLQGRRILLVEDAEDNQEIFRFFLSAAGAELDIVGDGLAAVDASRTRAYDLILMDVQLPLVDGREAARRIRKLGYTGPIVALTAHAIAEEREACLNAGCNGQITKPVTGSVLVAECASYLGPQAMARNPDNPPLRTSS